jgi:hypothetical protein
MQDDLPPPGIYTPHADSRSKADIVSRSRAAKIIETLKKPKETINSASDHHARALDGRNTVVLISAWF